MKGFELVNLKSGESKTVNFIIQDEMVQFYTNQGKKVVESVDFKVFVRSSLITFLEATFVLN